MIVEPYTKSASREITWKRYSPNCKISCTYMTILQTHCMATSVRSCLRIRTPSSSSRFFFSFTVVALARWFVSLSERLAPRVLLSNASHRVGRETGSCIHSTNDTKVIADT